MPGSRTRSSPALARSAVGDLGGDCLGHAAAPQGFVQPGSFDGSVLGARHGQSFDVRVFRVGSSSSLTGEAADSRAARNRVAMISVNTSANRTYSASVVVMGHRLAVAARRGGTGRDH